MNNPLWTPSKERKERSQMFRFLKEVQSHSREVQTPQTLYQWSIENPESFWRHCLRFCDLVGEFPEERTVLLEGKRFQDSRWFPGSTLNFAENFLRRRDHSPALVFWGEEQVRRSLSYSELYQQVARYQKNLSLIELAPGERVAGVLPNMPEAVIAMLATTSLGCIWTSCSPDFGIPGLLDRFGQVEPSVLFCVDYYFHKGKKYEVLDKAEALQKELPSLKKIIVIPYERENESSILPKGIESLSSFLKENAREMHFKRFPFEHPAYILYSSGTTGKPKCIVHSAGGTLLEHKKEQMLHTDLRSEDTLFYHTTCGWMMWNWLVSGLTVGARLVLFDGAPFHRDGAILLDLIEQEQVSIFGTSAKYLSALEKTGIKPTERYQFKELRTILSTGSPLAPESFEFVYRDFKQEVCLSSIAGGTDIVGCFALGNPLLPVYRGELQCRSLGYAVEVFDEQGSSLQGRQGELVCTKPFPSMPVSFWGDPDGSRYHSAYFERFPEVWHHGDFVTLTEQEGMIFHGRSDATLNPGGVRIGTAEIYRQVEKLSEIEEAVAVGREWKDDVRIILFVKLKEGTLLDTALENRIRKLLRENASPFHVPQVILAVSDIPRTRSGKISEIAVREKLHGRTLKNTEALANPESLSEFAALSEEILCRLEGL